MYTHNNFLSSSTTSTEDLINAIYEVDAKALYIDGSKSLTGNLNLDSNDIDNVASIDSKTNLLIGDTTATSVDIAREEILTNIKGDLKTDQNSITVGNNFSNLNNPRYKRELNVLGANASDFLGDSCDITPDGTHCIVGVPSFSSSGFSNNGKAIVYQYNDAAGVWAQKGTIDILGTVNSYQIGQSVAISADGLVVAVAGYNFDSNKGVIQIWKYNTTTPNEWALYDTILGVVANDFTGWSVSLSSTGLYLLITSRITASAGFCQVYEDNLTNFQTKRGSQFNGLVAAGRFGSSGDISADGSLFIVGGVFEGVNNSGTVSIYKWNGSTDYILTQTITTAYSNDRIGESVSLSPDGKHISFTGANSDADGGGVINAGLCEVYSSTDLLTWTQKGTTIYGAVNGDNPNRTSINSNGSLVAFSSIDFDSSGLTDNGLVQFLYYDGDSDLWVEYDRILGEITIENFGHSIAVSSNFNVAGIGANDNNTNGANSGAFRIYRADSYNNNQDLDTLTPKALNIGAYNATSINIGSGNTDIKINGLIEQIGQDVDGAAGQKLGYSVNFNKSGNLAIVGSPYDSSNKGKVGIYELKGSTWSLYQEIVGDSTNSYFGYSADINAIGDVIVVGAYGFNFNFGRVKIYKLISGVYTLDHTIDATTVDNLGRSVGISDSGTRIIVGANIFDGTGTDNGYFEVYEDTGSWALKGTRITGADTSQSGDEVAISGDGLIVGVGAINDYSLFGSIKIYEFTTDWTQKGTEQKGDAQNDRMFRLKINYDGSRIITGSLKTYSATLYGAVRVYEYVSDWVQIGSTISSEQLLSIDLGGVSVSINNEGNRIAVGYEFYDAESKTDSGLVRVYDYYHNDWVQFGVDIPGENASDQSSVNISLNGVGTRLIVGAHLNDGGGADSGSFRAYNLFNANFKDGMINADSINISQINSTVDNLIINSGVEVKGDITTTGLINFTSTNDYKIVDSSGSLNIFRDAVAKLSINDTQTVIQTAELSLENQAELKLKDTADGEYVGLKAPTAITTSYTLTMPVILGTETAVGNYLMSDEKGVCSFVDLRDLGYLNQTITAGSKTFGSTDNKIIFVAGGTSVMRVEADGDIAILAGGAIQLEDDAGGENVRIKAPATVTASYTLTLPAAQGTANQVLSNNGSGVLSWATVILDGGQAGVLSIGSNDNTFNLIAGGTTVVELTSAQIDLKVATVCPSLDARSAEVLEIGQSAATSVEIGKSGALTTVKGNLTIDGVVTYPMPRGEFYCLDNTTVTALVTGNYTRVAYLGSTCATDFATSFTVDIATNIGRLTYTGATTKTFHVGCTLSFFTSSNPRTVRVGLAKNYSTDANMVNSSIVERYVSNNDVGSTAIHSYITLATNDYIELYAKTITSTTNATFKHINIFAMAMAN